MLDALKEEFITEIEEMIDNSMRSLLEIENEAITPSSQQVQNIMRYLHSAKGGSSMFNYPKLSHGFHQVEDLFLSWVKVGQLPSGGLDYIFYFFDTAKNTLKQGDEHFHLASWGEQIKESTQNEPATVKSLSPSSNEASQAAPSAKSAQGTFKNSIQKTISSKISHHSDYASELLAYVIDPDPSSILEMIKSLRSNYFLTKNFDSITRSMMSIQEDHPDVIILNSKGYDYTKFNLVKDLINKKLPVPVIVIDPSFSNKRFKDFLGIGIKTVIADPNDLNLIIFKSRSHARAYRSQKLLNEAINLAIYQLGVINYPGQKLIPESNLEELKDQVKALMKAKKEFSDLG